MVHTPGKDVINTTVPCARLPILVDERHWGPMRLQKILNAVSHELLST